MLNYFIAAIFDIELPAWVMRINVAVSAIYPLLCNVLFLAYNGYLLWKRGDIAGLTLDISDDGKQLIVKRQGQVVETYLVHDDVKQLLNANINRAKSAENNPNPEASKDNIDNLVVNYEGEDYKIIISYYDFRRDYQGLSSVTIMFDMLTK